MTAMDDQVPLSWQPGQSSSATHFHNATIYHLHFNGVAPDTINCSSTTPKGLPSRPFFQHRPQEFVDGQRLDGSIYLGQQLIFGPPKPGQVIRRVEVDGELKVYVCHEELGVHYDQAQRFLQQHRDLSTEPLAESSTVLQHIFLTRGLHEQAPQEALRLAQATLSFLLEEKLRSFWGREKQLRDELNLNPTAAMARSFVGHALSYLQSRPATVYLDKDGRVDRNGESECSTHHIFVVGEDGIVLDFRSSLLQLSITKIPWSKLRPLRDLGVSFARADLRDAPMPSFFCDHDVGGGEAVPTLTTALTGMNLQEYEDSNEGLIVVGRASGEPNQC